EPSTRPARALPYQPNASITQHEFLPDNQILLWITLSNQGSTATRAAHFSVYANAYRGGGPWQYTVPTYDVESGSIWFGA
ncbi:MAG: hypothetical protein RL701_2843, partial [Pseudomonadota bacterium]